MNNIIIYTSGNENKPISPSFILHSFIWTQYKQKYLLNMSIVCAQCVIECYLDFVK